MTILESVGRLLDEAESLGATALHLIPGTVPRVRVGKELRPLEVSARDAASTPSPDGSLSAGEIVSLVEAVVPPDEMDTIKAHGQGELVLKISENHRHSATVYRASEEWHVVFNLADSVPNPVATAQP